MQYETLNGLRLPKIGLGTWRIGGGSSPDRSRDSQGLDALRSALDLGYAHFDTAELYGGGHAEELLGRAIRESGIGRESLFITSKVMPEHLRYDAVLHACERSLQRLGMDYLDLYLIHWPAPGIGLAESFRALNELVAGGKVRHIGVSNFDLKLLRASQELAETPILTNQVPYSVNVRSYARSGVLAYCQANEILLTAYSPVDEGRLKPDKRLREVASAHSVTPHQAALAWLVAQPRVITIPMSQDPEHQKQNLEAAEIGFSEEDMARLA